MAIIVKITSFTKEELIGLIAMKTVARYFLDKSNHLVYLSFFQEEAMFFI